MKASNGWTLRIHQGLLEQMARLKRSALKAQAKNPSSFQRHADFKLMSTLDYLMFEAIPQEPANSKYRLGHSLGPTFSHWRRAKIGRRFRLFFRFDSRSKLIIYVWVNDRNTLRSEGGQRDPYKIFLSMLNRDNPPDEGASLLEFSQQID